MSPKNRLLRNGIFYDLIGMATTAIPVIGPFLDLVWAPFAAKKMKEMYGGEKGKIASVVVFMEELLPMTDFIPSFTLMWVYSYVFSTKTKAVFN